MQIHIFVNKSCCK